MHAGSARGAATGFSPCGVNASASFNSIVAQKMQTDALLKEWDPPERACIILVEATLSAVSVTSRLPDRLVAQKTISVPFKSRKFPESSDLAFSMTARIFSAASAGGTSPNEDGSATPNRENTDRV